MGFVAIYTLNLYLADFLGRSCGNAPGLTPCPRLLCDMMVQGSLAPRLCRCDNLQHRPLDVMDRPPW